MRPSLLKVYRPLWLLESFLDLRARRLSPLVGSLESKVTEEAEEEEEWGEMSDCDLFRPIRSSCGLIESARGSFIHVVSSDSSLFGMPQSKSRLSVAPLGSIFGTLFPAGCCGSVRAAPRFFPPPPPPPLCPFFSNSR